MEKELERQIDYWTNNLKKAPNSRNSIEAILNALNKQLPKEPPKRKANIKPPKEPEERNIKRRKSPNQRKIT